MNKILSIFIINILFLISPSVGYSQWQYWCSDGEYYKLWTGCTDNNKQLLVKSYQGDFQAVQSLLKAGADVNYQDRYGRTALMRTARIEIVRSLLKAGADVNIQTDLGRTALMMASGEGHLEIVVALLKAGADVNHQDKYGNTTLYYARYYLEIVEVLIEAGATE